MIRILPGLPSLTDPRRYRGSKDDDMSESNETEACPPDDEIEKMTAKAAIEEYLELFKRLLPLEPKMATALLPKAHRKALEYCKLVGDE